MSPKLLELLFFMALAAFVAYRLYKVLGQEDDSNPMHKKGPRINPNQSATDSTSNVIDLEPINDVMPANIPKNVANTLVKMKEVDPSFIIEHFMIGAKSAFEIILSSFAKGDKETLNDLVGKDVRDVFYASIEEREENQETLETTLVSVVSCDIHNATFSNNVAQITVKLVSKQISLLKNNQGAIISGNPSDVQRLEDFWTFERDLTSSNPNWILVATGE